MSDTGKKIDDGGAAFPSTWIGNTGITLRDYIAAHALAGLLAYNGTADALEPMVKRAYLASDAMLAERNKSKEAAHE